MNSTRQRFAAVPWFTISPRGKTGMGRRQCTKEYKLRPIQKQTVELMDGKRPKGGCEMWIGISRDEIQRMKPSRVGYVVNRHPLIELDMHRRHCVDWLLKHYERRAPRSACTFCPYHNDAEWRALEPEDFADAVMIDAAIRHQPRMRGEQYVHRSLKPLDQVDFSTAEDRGQLNLAFGEECEGMCGV